MLGWVVKRKKTGIQQDVPEITRLVEIFRSVRSIDDCLALLKTENFLEAAGLDESGMDILLSVCQAMRSRGLGLEPNLLGRSVAGAMLGRSLAGMASIAFAAADTDIQAYIAEADTARDRKNFVEAEYHYWRALQLFPCHFGYLIQYAHCLKERGLPADALVAYLDAWFFGAPKQDVALHALHVAGAIGKQDKVAGILESAIRNAPGNVAGAAMGAALTSRDVRTLIHLFHLRAPSVDEVAHRMCDFASRRALALALLEEAEFARAHRDLLRMVAETSWGRNAH